MSPLRPARTILALFILSAQTTYGQEERYLDASTITAYGLECRKELGAIPLTFNCHDGTLLEVGGNDNPCENPPWLPFVKNGRCINGSRLLRLKTPKAGTEAILFCRRYQQRPDFDLKYEDIAIIVHNNTSGKTCYFQAPINYGGTNGARVPSPMADPDKAEETATAERAVRYWMAPHELFSGVGCTACHDNDVWVHTPYIDQVQGKNAVPNKRHDKWKGDSIDDPNRYSLVQQKYFLDRRGGWPAPTSVLTAKVRDDNGKVRPQVCIDCHRIADAWTKDLWIKWATNNPAGIIDQREDLNWTHYRWMPALPSDGKDDEAEKKWLNQYDNHIDAMECCLAAPDYNGCARMAVFGIGYPDNPLANKPVWGDAKNGTCIDDTGDVPLRALLDSKVKAAREADEDSCGTPFEKQATLEYSITHTRKNRTTQVFTESPAAKKLGHQKPDNSSHEPRSRAYPSDRVEIRILNKDAWGEGNALLSFYRWSDKNSGGPGDPNKCPCEDPSQPTCTFSTRGASDWFGSNPDRPVFPGDPENFHCVAQFKEVGKCKNPKHGSVPNNMRRLRGLIDCDCEHITGAIGLGVAIAHCEDAEKRLLQRVEQGDFYLTPGADGKIQYGYVCDAGAYGPSAWPLSGGPMDPPPKLDGPRCRYVGGLVQYECE